MEVGWALSIAGWIMSPITTRLLNKGFSLLGIDESEKLRDLEERLLPRLALMVEQAERSPPSRRRDHVEQWAKRLRSAFYDAEDILDVADYHRLEKQIISHSHMELKLRMQHIISGKTSKLKKVLKKLETIIEEGKPLASTISDGNGESNPATEVIRNVTTSSPLTQAIGRDEERDKIIRMLRAAPDDGEPSFNSMCYSVIGIYGVAGSGKTTLAQHVCSDERTKDHFCPVIWVHVSQSFDVRKIHQEMLEAASGEPNREYSNLDTLQTKLEAELRGKRFLLVLDDVWDVSVHKLDQLLSPLKVGKRGSKVLVTTRSADVSVSLGAQSPLKIPDLSRKDFFDLFMHYALGASRDDPEKEKFLMIGIEIMEKLKGSPLAARIVGGQLKNKLDANFWRRVGDDQDLLTDTMAALWWSYQHLDEHVRRCFAYCSIFPPRHRFERSKLVNLWMAQGFIKSTNDGDHMEDVGLKYFDELVSCSFLQTGQTPAGSENELFTVHDLLHDLAVMVAGNDFFRVGDGEMKEFPRDVRHLFIDCYDAKVAEQICKTKKLRTLIIDDHGSSESMITEQVLERMLKKLKKLRVVQVYLEGDMVMIPASICDLKHLRCLTIYNRRETKVYLPRKFDKLYHLQILEVPRSGVLIYSNVKNMSNLVSLRHIISFQEFYSGDSEGLGFPGVGKLKSLRELSDFRVRKEKGCELQQLQSLNYLHGSLRISGLENVESKERALEAKLTDKKYLTELSLAWSPGQRCSPHLEIEIIEGLCPPSELTRLEIKGYHGRKYPSWLSENQNGLGRLQFLLLACPNLEALPEIGEIFIHLRELRLICLDKIKRLPRLPDNLKRLDICELDSLVVTCVEDVEMIRSMFIERASQIEPSLKITHTEEIDKLADEQPDMFTAILSGVSGGHVDELSSIVPFIRGHIREEEYPQLLLPASLEEFIIEYCAITDTGLQNCLRGCTSLTRLAVYGIPFLRAMPCEVMKSLARLRHLKIVDCVNFTLLQGLHDLGHLENLTITDCVNFTLLQGLHNLGHLKSLTITDCVNFTLLQGLHDLGHLESLTITDCVNFTLLQGLHDLGHLESLTITDCVNFTLLQGLHDLGHLESLTITDCVNFTLLQGLHNLGHLKSLTITDCVNFTLLQGLHNLGHLESLTITDCVNFTLLQGLHDLGHLESLTITDCVNFTLLQGLHDLGHLESLTITDCVNFTLLQGLHNLGHLKSLTITDCVNFTLLQGLHDLGHLESLTITDCVNFTLLQGLHDLGHLESLTITDCVNFTLLQGLHNLGHLKSLTITDCVNFTLLQGLHDLDHLESLTIMKCPNLVALQEGEKARHLYAFTTDRISLVPQLLSREACSSLTGLAIDGSEEPEGEEILPQLTSLASLVFRRSNLNGLPENLADFTSLWELSLDSCKNIRSLPTLPASLRYFDVIGCDRLFTESCQRSGDPNCQKVAHIPNTIFRHGG